MTSMVHCTVFIERSVDEALRAYAESIAANKSAVYRQCVNVGLAQLSQGVGLPQVADERTTMRTVDLPVAVNQTLEGLGLRINLDRAELGMRLVRLGMATLIHMSGAATASRKGAKDD